ncbi:terminal uridylyltransferase 4-like isoform X2 [Mytilus californianus]|uniref:terminal uridylyltransferase 4-like isoform X2 n=1 Tax=Mytilus californianus TaxID=6549 RepID=UPI0022460DE8|nr:terminal uridylyltransferase 4-like isoform X2 [Mytilus californianus]
MAEEQVSDALSKEEIEVGIKKLINFGNTDDHNIVNLNTNSNLNPENNPDCTKKGTAAKEKHSALEDQHRSKESEKAHSKSKAKKSKKNKKKASELVTENVSDFKRDKQSHLAKQSTGQQSSKGMSQYQMEERDFLKPGLIISVNKESKRQITTYLSDGRDSVLSIKSGEEDPGLNSNDMKILVDSDMSEKEYTKRNKKMKKSTPDTGIGDDKEQEDKKLYNEKESQSHPNIDEASDRFWNSKMEDKKMRIGGSKGDNENGAQNRDNCGFVEDISLEILHQILEKDRIFPLKKKSVRFPRARYFCRVCDYHMDTLDDVRRHGKDHRHKRRVENINIQDELKRLTEPSEKQILTIESLLERTFNEHHLTKALMQERRETVQHLEIFLKKSLPDAKLNIFGSSFTGLGLKSSDVNVDLDVQKDHAKCLTVAFRAMKEYEKYENVISDFSSKVPCIYFTVSKVQYRITINNESARNCSLLLKLYAECDQRFLKMAVVLRYWAKICKIDRQDEGTLPAYSFYLLLVFFLQRCKPPVLPMLYQGTDITECVSPTKNRIQSKPELDFSEIQEMVNHWSSENTDSVGFLWIGLFKFYALEFELNAHVVCIRNLGVCTRAQKKWNSKKLAIEDPFSLKRNVSKSVAGFESFEYIWDCIRKAYHYFGQPTNCKQIKMDKKKKRIENIDSVILEKDSTQTKKDQTFKPKQKSTIENCGFQEGTRIEQNKLEATKTEYQPASNASTVINSVESNGTASSIKSSKTVTSSCDSSEAVNLSHAMDKCMDKNIEIPSKERYKQTESAKNLLINSEQKPSDSDMSQLTSFEDKNSEHLIQLAKCFVNEVLESALVSLNLPSRSLNCTENNLPVHNQSYSGMLEGEDTKERKDLKSLEQYNYVFQYSVLTDGKGPVIFCSLCEKEGHLKQSCPDEKLPELSVLPKLTKSHKDALSLLLKRIPGEYGPNELELQEREIVRRELEEFIQELYPDSRLHMFGSSYNGFGFSKSDLDLCVTFDKHPTGEGLDMVHFIEYISCKLKTHRGLYNVFPITSAKVPIVKFKHRRSQLEGDISMYNLLALHNTEMVRMYASIDPRVRILGYALKVFVKICDIGDASRGSLSSYAYILMLIHYLQQCKPPVIPVLQELYYHYGPDKPEFLIDGWNAWYFDNMETLPDVWLGYGKNKQSVGELWLELFCYYTEVFNMKEQVVCCRQIPVLTKFEKLWNSPCIAIEDPFDLGHNLGGGLSRKMQHYIQKAFIRGRDLYGNPRPDLGMKLEALAGFFFDVNRLSEGPPPNDRCCRACNKIGHIAKECPVVKNRKEREEKEKKKKAEYNHREGKRTFQANHTNNASKTENSNQHKNLGSYGKERVFHRTVSESHDLKFYPSNLESRSHPHRSASVPANCSIYENKPVSLGYKDFPQNINQQTYHPCNQGVPFYLPHQMSSSPGRSPSYHAGHQRQQKKTKNEQKKDKDVYRESQRQNQQETFLRLDEHYHRQSKGRFEPQL